MLLPIGTMAEGETSPYSACSAMAIDPIYIGVDAVPDFADAGGRSRLSPEALGALDRMKMSERVDYATVRRVKGQALDDAFGRFVEHEWEPRRARASALRTYIDRERWWLDDYALFQALSEAHSSKSWRDWPAALRDRDPAALEEARRTLARPVLRQQYLQWVAEGQWQAARRAAEEAGVAIFGDVPFVVNLHSADVWARADEFLLDVTVGVPPDAFSETGQDWGLPAYRWDVIARRGYEWLRQRARRMSALFSGFRIDHMIGFYRTYGRPAEGEPFFTPAEEADQIAQGEAVLRIFKDTGAALIAEDLGTVPDFLRPSLARLGVAGCKVLRWEREWKAPDQPFIDPATFPPISCAFTSTHDTHTLADWWNTAGPDERAALLQLPLLRTRGVHDPSQPWSDTLRNLLLELAWTSGSAELLSAVQDLFGWRDRINLPATVGEHNWTWRMPWAVDRLAEVAEASERAAFCRELTDRYRKA
jgi:4-alpha-glucanotransferase